MAQYVSSTNASFYQRVLSMQPWELIHLLEQEKLDVSGNETQLQVRLLSRQLERAYPPIPVASCKVGREDEWLEYVRQYERSIKAAYASWLVHHKPSLLAKIAACSLDDDELQREYKEISEMPKCRMIIEELFTEQHSSYAWPFYKPFDTELLRIRDYHDVIKKPMDLTTVKQKIGKAMYGCSLEFAADIRLIFSNCHKYFVAGHQFRSMATQLEKAFETRFSAEIYGKSITMGKKTKFEAVPTNEIKSSMDNNSIQTDHDGMPLSTCTQQELEAELRSTRQTMVEMMAEINTLREELAENRKRMESLEAALIQKENTKLNKIENQELEEDGIAYRLKCSQLMQIWKNYSEARQSPKEFLQNLKDFRKFARISDRVLFELLPCISPPWMKGFWRGITFDSWESLEKEFQRNFAYVMS